MVRRARRASTGPADREPHAGRPVPRAHRAGFAVTELLSRNWPAPAPGAAPMRTMIGSQGALEPRTLTRNGEQLLLTLIIPVLLLLAFGHEALISVGRGSRIDFVVPGILALAVLSTAFTSQAIGTGFERRYGGLKRLGASPLSRAGFIARQDVAARPAWPGLAPPVVPVAPR